MYGRITRRTGLVNNQDPTTRDKERQVQKKEYKDNRPVKSLLKATTIPEKMSINKERNKHYSAITNII